MVVVSVTAPDVFKSSERTSLLDCMLADVRLVACVSSKPLAFNELHFLRRKRRRIAKHHRLYNEERSKHLETKEDAATCYKD
jgi:hypothetical protein